MNCFSFLDDSNFRSYLLGAENDANEHSCRIYVAPRFPTMALVFPSNPPSPTLVSSEGNPSAQHPLYAILEGFVPIRNNLRSGFLRCFLIDRRGRPSRLRSSFRRDGDRDLL